MDIKILVAAHKKYRMPECDMYLPVHVGASGKDSIGYQRDDDGENISDMNPYYCELTGMYWLWKNVKADYYGLVHYRRYFTTRRFVNKKDYFSNILDRKDIEKILDKYDIVVPKKRTYVIESLYTHYAHTHYSEHMDITRAVIKDKYPEYSASFEKIMNKRSAHMFNMMIMSREKFNEYCSWLFPILSELENKIDYKSYDSFQARLFGRVSELLLNVWLDHKGYSYKELRTITMEKLDWKRKGTSFIRAKFRGEKYERSF